MSLIHVATSVSFQSIFILLSPAQLDLLLVEGEAIKNTSFLTLNLTNN